MSKSRRKNPYTGWATADSEKEWKRKQQRKLRKKVKQRMQNMDFEEFENEFLEDLKEISDVWTGPKDGKQRFDPDEHGKLMRK